MFPCVRAGVDRCEGVNHRSKVKGAPAFQPITRRTGALFLPQSTSRHLDLETYKMQAQPGQQGGLNQRLQINGDRQSGQDVRTQNVLAVCAIANIVKTSLGPVGLDKVCMGWAWAPMWYIDPLIGLLRCRCWWTTWVMSPSPTTGPRY